MVDSAISVVCFKWHGGPEREKYKAFSPRHVHALKQMVDKHLMMPHHFVCVTDNDVGFGPDISVVQLPNRFARMELCYPKLVLFSECFQNKLGDRILYLDLDVVITGSLDALIPNEGTEFMIHGKPIAFPFTQLIKSRAKRLQRSFYNRGVKYNGGMIYVKAGSKTEVFDSFSEDAASRIREKYRVAGSDQVWLAHCLGFNEPTWSTNDGVYSYGSDLKGGKISALPDDAKIVLFGGNYAPWYEDVLSRSPWVREHYPVALLKNDLL